MSLPLNSQAVKQQKPLSGLSLPLPKYFQAGNPSLLLCRSTLSREVALTERAELMAGADGTWAHPCSGEDIKPSKSKLRGPKCHGQKCNGKTSVSTGDNPGPSDTHCHGQGAMGVVGSGIIPVLQCSSLPSRMDAVQGWVLPMLPQLSGWCLTVGMRWEYLH